MLLFLLDHFAPPMYVLSMYTLYLAPLEYASKSGLFFTPYGGKSLNKKTEAI